MFGKNPIRAPISGSGEVLDVQSIFLTLQGEGTHVGTPAVFIRLGGCNLACAFCDTEFESFHSLSLNEIMQTVSRIKKSAKLAVITGGEPLRQPIEALCELLIQHGFIVQLETNGTLYRQLPLLTEIVCSPKNTNGKYFPIREDLLERITAIKFIISAAKPEYADIAEVGQSRRAIPVFLQPMDEYNEHQNKLNMKLATELALKYGYRLSLQTHKILGIE